MLLMQHCEILSSQFLDGPPKLNLYFKTAALVFHDKALPSSGHGIGKMSKHVDL